MKEETSNTFESGSLVWVSGIFPPEDLALRFLEKAWDDGFVAFSNGERRVNTIGGRQAMADLLAQRIEGQDGLEGFLMEGGLWRASTTSVYEELAMEREGDNFFVQHWRLSPEKMANKEEMPCFYRKAQTFVRGNLVNIFPEQTIPTFEVIVPEHRLRFYIIRGK